jgi:hypothetical protein
MCQADLKFPEVAALIICDCCRTTALCTLSSSPLQTNVRSLKFPDRSILRRTRFACPALIFGHGKPG